MPTFNFKSSFLKKPAALARRPDYGSGSTAKLAETPWDKPMADKPLMAYRKYRCENCGHEQNIQTNHTGMVYDYCKDCSWKGQAFGKGLGGPIGGLGTQIYRPFKLTEDPAVEVKRRDDKFLNSVGVTAAAGSAPREYPVKKDKEGFWYVMGLPGEELSEGMKDAPVVPTPNTWLNVHNQVKGLELAEQLYRELYAEFQTNDNLREGDIFNTPVGKFICQGVDVFPYDEPAKRIIGEVDDSYKCTCGCDQGEHRKKFDDNGYPYYGECTQHPECKEYVKRG